MNVTKKNKFMFLISVVLLLNNHHLLGSSVNTKDTMSQKMQEKVLQSPFKALLHRSDGKKIMAYLYAKDEKSELTECDSRIDGSSYTTIARDGHFQIYLYDVEQGKFLPFITPIFKDWDETSFNVEGSKIVVLPGMQEGKSDVLLISQFGTGEGDFYEAYGFSPDNLSFKNYIFNNNMKSKQTQFYGTIVRHDKENKMFAYTVHQKYEIGGFEIVNVNIALSKTPGEIDLPYVE